MTFTPLHHSRPLSVAIATMAIASLSSLSSLVPFSHSGAQAQTQLDWSTIEQDIIEEHRSVRQNPQSYIPLLEERLARMDANGNIPNGCGPNCTLLTQEGQAAVEEAIAFLRNQSPLDPVRLSEGAATAAKNHAQDQAGGATGHTGSDGSSADQRIREQVAATISRTGENIAYGSTTGQEVVLDLIIDDGVPSRGHRTNIFDPNWTHAGAGCGPHARYRTVCVINYLTERQGSGATGRNPSDNQPAPVPSANNQLTVVNNGTVDLRSLQIGGVDRLGGSLTPGDSRQIPLAESQCDADLTVQLGGNYNPLLWEGVSLCGSVLTIDRQNSFRLEYQTTRL